MEKSALFVTLLAPLYLNATHCSSSLLPNLPFSIGDQYILVPPERRSGEKLHQVLAQQSNAVCIEACFCCVFVCKINNVIFRICVKVNGRIDIVINVPLCLLNVVRGWSLIQEILSLLWPLNRSDGNRGLGWSID